MSGISLGHGLLWLLSFLAAAIPTTLYVSLVWWLDRYEKEPASLLAVTFLWGAVPSAFLSIVAEVILGIPIGLLGSKAAAMLETGLVAPIVEEAFKAFILFLLFVVYHKELDDVLDGIVYGAVVGSGFALTENTLYFLDAFRSGGVGAWGAVVFLRTIIFGLNHAFFTAITGASLGLARYARYSWQQVLAPLAGLSLAIAFHAVHNLFARLGSVFWGAIIISAVSDWAGVAFVFVLIALAWQREKAWISQELADEVPRGTITGQEYALLQSPGWRWAARWQTLWNDGWAAYARLGRFFQLSTELAFKKHQARLMGDEDGNAREIQALRVRIAQLRGQARRGGQVAG